MAERTRVTKTTETKAKASSSRVRKSEHTQFINSPAEQILFLQRTAGNQAVQRLIKSGALQAKLTISEPGDVYEKEADRVADQVMRMPDPMLQRQNKPGEEEEDKVLQTKPLADSISPLVQRQVDEEEMKEKQIQAKEAAGEAPEISPDIHTRITDLHASGESLPKSTREFFEPRFGYKFSQVRIHTDAQAAKLAQEVNARAFTVGSDIAFGTEQYSPRTSSGKRLLAHELTHVIQQGGESNHSTAVLRHNKKIAPQIQREATALAAAGVVLSGVSVAQDRISYSTGGLEYSSDQISYPKDLDMVENNITKSTVVAEFRSGLFSENKTVFQLHGEFSDNYQKANGKNRVMANVYIDRDPDTTSYYISSLKFNARALEKPYGTPDDPKIRFVCNGRFDPAGIGDCEYRVVLEVNQHGDVSCIDSKIGGNGHIGCYKYFGFVLTVG